MRIGFIGAGSVGTAFGSYLVSKGVEVSGYYSRSQSSAKLACKRTNSRLFNDSHSLLKASQLVFITTNDDQIEVIARQIAADKPNLTQKYLAHMSGALSSTVLCDLELLGARTYSLHPMQSFADVDKAIVDLSSTYFGLEGQHELNVITNLLEIIGNPYILLEASQKTRYHIASCVVSNYLTAVLDFGLEMMDSIGINKSKAYSALLPMINGTVQNIKQMGTERALTGPIARGDVRTIEKHLGVLAGNTDNELETYQHLGELTLKLSEKAKLKNSDHREKLHRLLSR